MDDDNDDVDVDVDVVDDSAVNDKDDKDDSDDDDNFINIDDVDNDDNNLSNIDNSNNNSSIFTNLSTTTFVTSTRYYYCQFSRYIDEFSIVTINTS